MPSHGFAVHARHVVSKRLGVCAGPHPPPTHMNAALQRAAAAAVTRAGTRVHRDAHAPGSAMPILLAVDGGRSAASAVTS